MRRAPGSFSVSSSRAPRTSSSEPTGWQWRSRCPHRTATWASTQEAVADIAPEDKGLAFHIVRPPANRAAARKVYDEMRQKLAFNPRERLGV